MRAMAEDKDREKPERQPSEDEPELRPDPDLVSYLDEEPDGDEPRPDPELASPELRYFTFTDLLRPARRRKRR